MLQQFEENIKNQKSSKTVLESDMQKNTNIQDHADDSQAQIVAKCMSVSSNKVQIHSESVQQKQQTYPYLGRDRQQSMSEFPNFLPLPCQYSFMRQKQKCSQPIQNHDNNEEQHSTTTNKISFPQFLYKMTHDGRLTKNHIDSFGDAFISMYYQRYEQMPINFKKQYTVRQRQSNVQTHASPSMQEIKQQQEWILIKSQLTKRQQQSINFDNTGQVKKNTTRKNTTRKNNKSRITESFLSQSAHYILLKMFLDSMRGVGVYHIIRQFCRRIQTWQQGSGMESFMNKLIAIRIFFPQYFQMIIKSFGIKIQQFRRKKQKSENQIYAQQILILRYLKCVNEYARSKDVLKSAKQLYSDPFLGDLYQKISKYQDYQKQIIYKKQKWNLYINKDNQQTKRMMLIQGIS